MLLLLLLLCRLMMYVQRSEELLKRQLVNGAFLVRKSDKEPDTYVVSVVCEGHIFHNKVRLSTCGVV